jgi:hypothetical protein
VEPDLPILIQDAGRQSRRGGAAAYVTEAKTPPQLARPLEIRIQE